MSSTSVVIQGTLKPDGTLELDQKPGLPAGRVRVTLEVEVPQVKEDTWTVLERIWKERAALGIKPRTREEIDADVQALRDELEAHANAIERLQDEARQAREKPPC
jgi:hypothetical protein